jgi:membrane-associated protein
MHKKMVIFVSVLSLLTNIVNATPITLKIVNQYEAGVDKFTVQEKDKKTAVQLQSDGSCTLDLTGVDSIILSADGYKDLTVSAEKLTNGNTIAMYKKFSWKDLVNPMFYILYGGLWLLLFIIFAETGLFAGFFLPGDSLLFVAGIYSKNLGHEFFKIFGATAIQPEWMNLSVLITLVVLAGILGNSTGYWFGKKIGPAMFQWKDNLLFKQKYLHQAQEFYDKHGGGAIVIARFIPIIRTFAPIISGIVQMSKSKFTYFNIVGCIAWVGSMILGGHFLQQWILNQFGFNLKSHLEVIVIGIVLISTLPVIIKLVTGKKN